MTDTTKRYFVFDPNEGYSKFFETEEEQLSYANNCIDQYLDGGGWDEDVIDIVVGIVTYEVRKVFVAKRPPEDEISKEGFDKDSNYWGKGCEELCDYEAVPVEKAGEVKS